MINRYQYKDARWIDVVNPTHEEVKQITHEYNLHPYVSEELTSPSIKSRAESFEHYIYLILHFPAFRLSRNRKRAEQEVDFIIGKDFLLTIRYGSIDALEKFAKVVEVNQILDRGSGKNNSGLIFFGIMQEIYSSLINELEYISTQMTKIEEQIFQGKEREMVISLSEVARNLINFKKSISFHDEVLSSLDSLSKRLFDDQFSTLTRMTIDEYKKVDEILKSSMESLAELRETNNSLLTTKQNEVMKVLTIMAFIGIPLSLLAALLQIDTSSRPIIGQPNDFWILLSIMFAIGFFMFSFFKYKKWL